jgi:hypothetical protein
MKQSHIQLFVVQKKLINDYSILHWAIKSKRSLHNPEKETKGGKMCHKMTVKLQRKQLGGTLKETG